jgi:HSP20 family protein
MLMRFDPFRDFDRLTQQLWGGGQGGSRTNAMPMDAYREGDHFTVHFDLPGVDPGSIELTVDRNVLTVSAERKWSRGEGTDVVASERVQGTFTRQLFLGESLDADRIEANYDNGVLTVRIPVAEQAKPRRIEIGGGQSAQQAITASSTEQSGASAA